MPSKAEEKKAAPVLKLVNNEKRSSTDLVLTVREKAAQIVKLRMKDDEWTNEQFDREFENVLNCYRPNFAFSSLYIRLGRQFRRHYNTDSISVVRILSQQCGISVLQLLKECKSYFVAKPSRPFDEDTCTGGLAPYGFRIMFSMRRYQKLGADPQLVCPEKLQEILVGVNLSCSMLETMIVDNSSVMFTNLGRNQESENEFFEFEGRQQPTLPLLNAETVGAKRARMEMNKKTSKRQKKTSISSEKEATSPSIVLSEFPKLTNEEQDQMKQIFGDPNDDDDGDQDDHGDDDASNDLNSPEGARQQLAAIFGESTPTSHQPGNVAPDAASRLQGENDPNVFRHSSKALLRTHLIKTFGKRLWSNVEHRLLALEVVEVIMTTALSHCGIHEVREEELLALSYRITADDQERKDFLECLTLYCLFYSSREKIIADVNFLVNTLWDSRNKAGFDVATEWESHVKQNNVALSDQAKVIQMDEPFEKLREQSKGNNYEPKTHGMPVLESQAKWWTCIRARVFSLYLDFSGNRSIKNLLKKYKNPNHVTDSKPTKKRRRKSERRKNKSSSTDQGHSLRASESNNETPTAQGNEILSPFESVPDITGILSVAEQLKERKREQEEKTSSASSAANPTETIVQETPQARVNMAATINNNEEQVPVSSLPDLRDDPEIIKRLRMATEEDFATAAVDSRLVIEHGDVKTHLYLSNLQFYLANHLRRYRHGRVVRKIGRDNNFDPSKSETSHHIALGPLERQYIDRTRNLLHACTLESDLAKYSQYFAKFKLDAPLIIQALLDYRKTDNNRAPDAVEFNFGSASAQCPGPYGMGKNGLFSKCEDSSMLKDMIRNWALLIWDINSNMLKKAKKTGLAVRPQGSDPMKEFLGIKPSVEFGYESATLRFEEISPHIPRHKLHTDVPNCMLPGSSYTGASNICITDPVTGRMYLLQLILNYRSAITSKCIPYYRSVVAISEHINRLVDQIETEMTDIFCGQEAPHQLPSPLDLTNFYIDDNLPYKELRIDNKKESKGAIKLEVITLPIGFSRVFSLSAMIHQLQEARPHLNRRQAVELCFIGSMLNTPVRFHYVMKRLLKDIKSKKRQFGLHPFDDWLEETMKLFGNWQGGPLNRYNSAGIADIGKFFSSSESGGSQRLTEVVDVLCDFLDWIDTWVGKKRPEEIPISEVEEKMSEVAAAVSKAAGPDFKNFALFRLGIFLTLATGASLVKPGPHVRQLFFPIVGKASYNHLTTSEGGTMTGDEAAALVGNLTKQKNKENQNFDVTLDDFDHIMMLVCRGLGFSDSNIFRDFMECALCESMHSRSLNKRDVIVRGVPLYRLDENGQVLRREVGWDKGWEVVVPEALVEEEEDDQLAEEKSDLIMHYSGVENDQVAKKLASALFTDVRIQELQKCDGRLVWQGSITLESVSGKTLLKLTAKNEALQS